jgi:hypothetical protein
MEFSRVFMEQSVQRKGFAKYPAGETTVQAASASFRLDTPRR